MILKGSQRGGAIQLARHLLNTAENEHVHVHDIRGFMADDLESAFQEAYAVSRGTRARQFLFSLSMNPPLQENVPTHTFEMAIEAVEQKLGLNGQPRAVVFHEKEGRRHAHVVWSRIDTEQMKAINLPHYKLKLRDISKQLYLENGWQMPREFMDSRERDPANFTLNEWQQAKRGGHDPKALKRMFQECWAIADSRQTFAKALKERGYTLARGDRRGYVAVCCR
ncbi:relaxase/mobilization nuclease domain-containing protein [Pseudomonas aeruginosa]